MINPQLILILTAAGSSTRMGTGTKKEYLTYNGGTVLSTSALTFLKTLNFNKVIITTPKDGTKQAEQIFFSDSRLKDFTDNSSFYFIEGAETRQKSIYNALQFADNLIDKTTTAYVFIHDGARPFVTEKIILDCYNAAVLYGASAPVIPVVDTQKQLDSEGKIQAHLLRSSLGAIQTPQVFEFTSLFNCHKKALAVNKEFTDDTEIWDSFPEYTNSRKVQTVQGDVKNFKITYKEDLQKIRQEKMLRIGLGTDLHKLVEGRKFYLGGIEIPSPKGEEAHSDGDVLLHAITDALLGASGMGDIGSYFPPSDPKWKDACSVDLIKTVWNDIKAEGWDLVNLDCVVETELPKLLPWREKIINSIAQILEVENNQVFVKAKTNEKQDSIGLGNSIKAYCTCLLEK